MKKGLIIGLAVLMVLGLSLIAVADIDFHTHFFLTGTTATATAAGTPGSIQVTGSNTDAFSQFTGTGGNITGDMWINSQNPYLDSDVDASGTSGALLQYQGWQNLAGYTSNQVMVNAAATGTASSDMNIRFDNSNYVVQFERHDTSKDMLAASGTGYSIGYQMDIFDPTPVTSSAQVGVLVSDVGGTGGSASLDTNQWHATSIGSYGWGNPDGIVAPSPPGYYTPTNVLNGAGGGQASFYGFGNNSFNFGCGLSMPEGGGALGGGVFQFNNTINGTYNFIAK